MNVSRTLIQVHFGQCDKQIIIFTIWLISNKWQTIKWYTIFHKYIQNKINNGMLQVNLGITKLYYLVWKMYIMNFLINRDQGCHC